MPEAALGEQILSLFTGVWSLGMIFCRYLRDFSAWATLYTNAGCRLFFHELTKNQLNLKNMVWGKLKFLNMYPL